MIILNIIAVIACVIALISLIKADYNYPFKKTQIITFSVLICLNIISVINLLILK